MTEHTHTTLVDGCYRCELNRDELPNLRWHYGPTEINPDPARRWCYDCGGEVHCDEDGYVCLGCHRWSDD